MRKSIILTAALVVSATLAPSLFAQATRTWVSGVGDDANPCSRTAPCKTFAGAISKTAAGGEIDVLDPGGFGTVTITKGITIDGGGGGAASILASGTNGVNINTSGANDVVKLRNLSINGAGVGGPSGIIGVRIINGHEVVVENCEIFNFTSRGISDERTTTAGPLIIRNTRISTILGLNAFGLVVLPSSNAANVLNADYLYVSNAQAGAAYLANGVRATISNSEFTNSGAGVTLQNVVSDVIANFDSVRIANNAGDGLTVIGTVTARLTRSSIVNNGNNAGTNGINISGGVVESAGNNLIRGNGGNNTAGVTSIGQQ